MYSVRAASARPPELRSDRQPNRLATAVASHIPVVMLDTHLIFKLKVIKPYIFTYLKMSFFLLVECYVLQNLRVFLAAITH